MSLLTLDHITMVYNNGKPNAVHALTDVSLSVSAGEMVAVVGASGSGKSTLLHILGGLLRPTSGTYAAGGETVSFLSTGQLARFRNGKVGFVLQDFGLLEERTVLENVSLPMLFSPKPMGRYADAVKSKLTLLDMEPYLNKRVSQLSGGQKQRVAVARALIMDPLVILADEPTGALDSSNALQLFKLFRSLCSEGHTLVVATHDMDLAAQCDRIIRLADGRVRPAA